MFRYKKEKSLHFVRSSLSPSLVRALVLPSGSWPHITYPLRNFYLASAQTRRASLIVNLLFISCSARFARLISDITLASSAIPRMWSRPTLTSRFTCYFSTLYHTASSRSSVTLSPAVCSSLDALSADAV